MKFSINAKSLRIVLFVGMILLVAGAVMGFIFARNQLQAFASSISQMEADAASVDKNIETLKQLETTLKDTQDIKEKVNSITVPASEYPVAVIANITEIASRSGVKLTSINYGDATGVTNGITQNNPSDAASTPTPSQTPAPNGVTKKTVNVTVESPVSYNALMNFIKGIETDDMYMQIAKVSLTKAEGSSVNVQPFTIEVYTK